MSNNKKVEIVDGMINFACLKKECETPCCGPFSGVNQDIDSVHGREFHDIVLTPEDYKGVIENGRIDLVEAGEDGHVRMRLKDDGTCEAFIDGKCSIHEFKPSICRAYPFYLDMFTGLCASISCPGFGGGWTPLEDLKPEIECTAAMYKYWLEFVDKDLENMEKD